MVVWRYEQVRYLPTTIKRQQISSYLFHLQEGNDHSQFSNRNPKTPVRRYELSVAPQPFRVLMIAFSSFIFVSFRKTFMLMLKDNYMSWERHLPSSCLKICMITLSQSLKNWQQYFPMKSHYTFVTFKFFFPLHFWFLIHTYHQIPAASSFTFVKWGIRQNNIHAIGSLLFYYTIVFSTRKFAWASLPFLCY